MECFEVDSNSEGHDEFERDIFTIDGFKHIFLIYDASKWFSIYLKLLSLSPEICKIAISCRLMIEDIGFNFVNESMDFDLQKEYHRFSVQIK